MSRQPESPRFVLILGGLFLIAYAAYRVGSAWMVALPIANPPLTLAQPYPEPESTSTPAEPYPEPTIILVEAYPGLEITTTPTQSFPETEITNTPAQPYPGSDATSTPVQPYPQPEITNTPANATPTVTPTLTEVAPTQPQPTATPTLEDLPTATSTGNAYPGPEQTLTPVNTATTDPGNPYPGPEQTATPQAPTSTTDGNQPSSTPTLSPTPLPNTPTHTPTQGQLPTLENTPTPITTLPYSQTQIITDGSVNQAIWLGENTRLALATSNGVVLYHLPTDESQILDAGFPIVSVARIPDNDWIAAGGRDSLIRIWHQSTGSFITYLSGHLLGVVRLYYAQAGDFLASASDDATVRIWYDDGSSLQILRGPITRVVDMAVSSNGQMVAAASNQSVHIWNPQTAELLHTISFSTGWYSAVTFSPNSQILTTAYDGRKLEFWDTTTWERVDFIALDAPVQSLVYSPNGRFLAIGYVDGRIKIWDSGYGFLLANLAGHQQITSMAFSPYGDQLVTSSANGSIRIWDLTPLFIP